MSRKRTSHLRIADHLRGRIQAGGLKRGDRLPSFQQLHRQFGVTPRTVSKALDVLELDGLVDRRKFSGTYVARDAIQARAPRLAVIGGQFDFPSDYCMGMLTGVRSAGLAHDAHIAWPGRLEEVDWSEFDGVLAYEMMPETVTQLLPESMPYVIAGDPFEGAPSFSWNDFEAGVLATEHLIRIGHERIGFMGWLGNETASSLRSAGYRIALGRAGIEYREKYLWPLRHGTGEGMVPHGAANMDMWVENGFADLGCTAIIAQNDFVAMGVIQALVRNGWDVPGDVSVVGFDNERAGLEFRPALTSVAADMHELGFLAIESLVKMVTGQPVPPVATLLPVTISARESTAPPKKTFTVSQGAYGPANGARSHI